MSLSSQNPGDRFNAPQGWQWSAFENTQGLEIRYAYGAPQDPGVLVAILPGRAEFIEKYFETARNLMDQGCAVCVMDWAGQGGSGRLADDQRADVPDFVLLADDLHALLVDHLPEELRMLPKIMLAQSMGANAGLRFIKLFPDVFSGAALCAPMLGMQDVKMPVWLAIVLCKIFTILTNNAYAFGQKPWDPEERKISDKFSSDPARSAVHDAWYAAEPALRTGGVSFNWLYNSLRSCAAIARLGFVRGIDTQCLFALAGDEKIVDNDAARTLAARLKNSEVLDLPGAGHEILMERDDIREKFLARFYGFIEQCIEKKK